MGNGRGDDGSLEAPRGVLEAGWFNGFSEGESTYTADADGLAHRDENPTVHFQDGWVPHTFGFPPRAVAPEAFHESPSGGSKEAWQTHYPALRTGLVGRAVNLGDWAQNAGGSWSQDLAPTQSGHPGPLDASWFDTSAIQYDNFGRPKEPNAHNGKRYVWWEERSVNTTLVCPKPGCRGSSAVQIFNGLTERAKHCKLSFDVTPTDFEEDHSDEYVDWITVNGAIVSTQCKPKSHGCSPEAQAPLHRCIMDLPLDHLITQSGVLNLEAKISDTVDECPYQGNYLHAVPMVTCLVAPIQKAPKLHHVLQGDGWHYTKIPLQCTKRGCKATGVMHVNQTTELVNTCKLTVKVNQTDFDNDAGNKEQIDFLKVDGAFVAKEVKPGKNPCKAVLAGKPLPADQLEYTVIDGKDVSEAAKDGRLDIEMQISRSVEECASQGFLLDGFAEANCTVKPVPASVASGPNAGGKSSVPLFIEEKQPAVALLATGARHLRGLSHI
eukprot:gnl/TRDRNA2_/TRDRNA2_151662_c0_seq1.p1 gnl/TRDRNA2_/TRDRNA2_151662_c0~~gnl/TRDRNA2_/TRDRNA2_151662_c0_seq1.p1  ORF type:complete len:567 (+),score=103.73 gnl/TRDRNA2_/TRDRNA2_151662_c0_seq1:218-1702(+)